MKDIAFGPIPAPHPLIAATLTAGTQNQIGAVSFKYFFDDDYGSTNTFAQMLWFLHTKYFPRMCWAKLTLKPQKSSFFVGSIEPLGMHVGLHHTVDGVRYVMRASAKKRSKIGQFPVLTSGKEVEEFLYMGIPRFCPSDKSVIRYEPSVGMLLPDGALLIQCDGSCRNNGGREARAAIGIYCGENHKKNFAGTVPPHLPQTNQIAELWAMAKALQIGKEVSCESGLSKLIIASDSEYVCLGLTCWISKWKKTGYKGVQNALMFADLEQQIKDLKTHDNVQVEIWKVTREGNTAADKLAQRFQETSRADEARANEAPVEKAPVDEDTSDAIKW